MSNCECPIAGWCQRHNVHKNEHWHQLCQTRGDYFATWEEGHGPGQHEHPPAPTQPPPRDNPWTVIHTRLGQAIGQPWHQEEQIQWYKTKWMPTIPSFGCACKNHWRHLTQEHPINWTSAESAFHDLWKLHNLVSEQKAGKPTITLEEAQSLYIKSES